MTEPIPAATVVAMKDGPSGPEVLMVRRNSKLDFAGGMWVFPGGRIDQRDRRPGEPLEIAARRAAVREAAEETGLVIDPDELVWFSHWMPPPSAPKRFATYFFLVRLHGNNDQIVVDGSEIQDHEWLTPVDALRRRNAKEIELAPPTWITLEHLVPFSTTAAALRHFASREVEYFETRIASLDGTIVALYHGDAGYESADAAAEGPRHRLWMSPDGWHYERLPS
ncbi:MAG: NUDIX hydrolase [Acidimicrobiales bacterium]|nr:NUDIX hydrolase [Acidimicrobiales bacterium]